MNGASITVHAIDEKCTGRKQAKGEETQKDGKGMTVISSNDAGREGTSGHEQDRTSDFLHSRQL